MYAQLNLKSAPYHVPSSMSHERRSAYAFGFEEAAASKSGERIPNAQTLAAMREARALTKANELRIQNAMNNG